MSWCKDFKLSETSVIAEPYALKEFKNRWYVLANQKLTLFATRDFIMEIMSFGEDVKVVGPEELVMEVKKGFDGGLKMYC